MELELSPKAELTAHIQLSVSVSLKQEFEELRADLEAAGISSRNTMEAVIRKLIPELRAKLAAYNPQNGSLATKKRPGRKPGRASGIEDLTPPSAVNDSAQTLNGADEGETD
jgi:hypothetical protein